MSDSENKFCVNCLHHSDGFSEPLCALGEYAYKDVVYGIKRFNAKCRQERSSTGKCGPNGKNFERMPEPQIKPSKLYSFFDTSAKKEILIILLSGGLSGIAVVLLFFYFLKHITG